MLRNISIAILKTGSRWFGGMGLSRVPIIGGMYRSIARIAATTDVPESITVHGSVLHLLPGDNMGLSIWGEDYERGVAALVSKTVKPGDIFIDVGANIGFFTLYAARCVGPSGRVIAFEPDLENIALLNRNILENGFGDRVVCEAKALSDKPGTLVLYRSAHNGGDHTTYDRQAGIATFASEGKLDVHGAYDQHSATDPRIPVSIEAVSLDSYLGDGRVDFIKMDVQGAEGLALKGMANILRRANAPKIVFEFWPAGMELSGSSARAALELLQESGYHFNIVDDVHGDAKPTTIQALSTSYTVYNNKTTNVYCVK
jgi:FkbM family methyltransferase